MSALHTFSLSHLGKSFFGLGCSFSELPRGELHCRFSGVVIALADSDAAASNISTAIAVVAGATAFEVTTTAGGATPAVVVLAAFVVVTVVAVVVSVGSAIISSRDWAPLNIF